MKYAHFLAILCVLLLMPFAISAETETEDHDCNEKFVEYTYSYPDPVYTLVNACMHQMSSTPVAHRYCHACRQTLPDEVSSEVKLHAPEFHHFKDGYCEDCGIKNTCAHTDVHPNIINEWDKERIQFISLSSHTVIGDLIEQRVCSDCGEILGTNIIAEDIWGTFTHDYEKDACWVCGFENPCEHDSITSWYYVSIPVYRLVRIHCSTRLQGLWFTTSRSCCTFFARRCQPVC